ncbi:MAG: acetylxylan esterase [Cyclobacteriaceae bacterium]|nr:acetylxylan esterase [Cyclobacteriaceae bacterium]
MITSLHKVTKSLLVFAVVAFSFFRMMAQDEKATLDYWPFYSDAQNSLYKIQCNYSFAFLNMRKAKIASLDTKEEWLTRQNEVKEILHRIVGPFPDKTPLNPVVTGMLKGDGFSVEKLYFESMPGYRVTAAFFIPEGKKQKLPTIIYCSGHTDLGFRSETYQHVIINLVKKGFAVLAFDPVGQGERQQYFDVASGKSRFRPTHEHSFPGAQMFISGSSAARMMTWDGIRAVDYLLTRREVDPARIGITGRSGGGTQTAYIAALDDRINVAAPECYITSFEYLLKSGGPQDAEQNLFHGLKEGFDLADLLEVRAPKPTLMITTTRDIFSIQGARETYLEAKNAYSTLGFSENLQMAEDDAGHESTLKNREAMYAFFQQHLQHPGSAKDLEVTPFPVAELYVTPDGQLATSIGSKFLFDVNQAAAAEALEQLKTKRDHEPTFLMDLKNTVKTIAGYEKPMDYGKLIFSGRTEFPQYYLNKYVVESVAKLVLPFRLLTPKNQFTKVAIYLDNQEGGKSLEIPLRLVESGIAVIIPELPGYGELGPGYLKGDANFNNTSYNQWFAGILTGKSTVAVHAESIEIILKHCKSMLAEDVVEMIGISNGPLNSVLLHAAAFDIHFDAMLLVNPLATFESIVMNRNYDPSFIPFAVAGSLPHYDLPDLVALFAPGKIMLLNARNEMGDPLSLATVDAAYVFAKKRYLSIGSENKFSVVLEEDFGAIGQTILKWLE